MASFTGPWLVDEAIQAKPILVSVRLDSLLHCPHPLNRISLWNGLHDLLTEVKNKAAVILKYDIEHARWLWHQFIVFWLDTLQ